MPPTLNFPMPPLAPLPPLPAELGSPTTFSSELSDSTTLTDFDLEPLQTPPPSERSPISIIDADVQPFSLDDLAIYGGKVNGFGMNGFTPIDAGPRYNGNGVYANGVNGTNGLNGLNGHNGVNGHNGSLNGLNGILDSNRDRSSSTSTQSTLNDPPMLNGSLGLTHPTLSSHSTLSNISNISSILSLSSISSISGKFQLT